MQCAGIAPRQLGQRLHAEGDSRLQAGLFVGCHPFNLGDWKRVGPNVIDLAVAILFGRPRCGGVAPHRPLADIPIVQIGNAEVGIVRGEAGEVPARLETGGASEFKSGLEGVADVRVAPVDLGVSAVDQKNGERPDAFRAAICCRHVEHARVGLKHERTARSLF